MRKRISLIVLLGATILALMPVQPVQPVKQVQAKSFYEEYYFDPPPTSWAGQLIYTRYYMDETYSGPAFECEANTCTGIEYCPLPKTPYFIEWRRITVSCTGIL